MNSSHINPGEIAFTFEIRPSMASRHTADLASVDLLVKSAKKIIEARANMKDDTDEGRKALAFLIQQFGPGVADHIAFKNQERLMFTLDLHRRVFRCWYSPFGTIGPFTDDVEHLHFDSCGGLLFHATSEDSGRLMTFAQAMTQGMVEWNSKFGSLWAGSSNS